MIPICKTCLKHPVCKNKQKLVCPDLFKQILKWDGDKYTTGERVAAFEKWWGKELAVINLADQTMRFKEKEDQFSCLICRA